MSLLVLGLALVTIAYAAPPIVPPANLAPCVDGVNNVVQLDDVTEPTLTIHAKDVVAQTYDAKGKPSCYYYYGRAAVSLPGQIKLVKGTVVVSAANAEIKKAEMKLSLKKNSVFIGTVCENGVNTVFLGTVCENGVNKKAQVPPDVCHHPIYPDIGDKFLQMLSTPGSYDMEVIEKEAHQSNIINIPGISNTLNTFVVKVSVTALYELRTKVVAYAEVVLPLFTSCQPWKTTSGSNQYWGLKGEWCTGTCGI
ncbi:hypothetical protein COOONC_09506 [Cooperia oncophora]